MICRSVAGNAGRSAAGGPCCDETAAESATTIRRHVATFGMRDILTLEESADARSVRCCPAAVAGRYARIYAAIRRHGRAHQGRRAAAVARAVPLSHAYR